LFAGTLKLEESEESPTKPADRSGISGIGNPKFAGDEEL